MKPRRGSYTLYTMQRNFSSGGASTVVGPEEYVQLENDFGVEAPHLVSLAGVWAESTQRIALPSTSSSLWTATPETVQDFGSLLRLTGRGVATVRMTTTFTRPAPLSATDVVFSSERALVCEQRSALHHALTGQSLDCDGQPTVSHSRDALVSSLSFHNRLI